MTNKNVICILGNDLKFLKAMFKNWPSEIPDLPVLIINEIRIGNHIQEIQDLCDKYGINAKVVGSDTVNEYCKEVLDLTEDGEAFLDNYNMGMNILTQLYVFGKSKTIDKMLFIDDDVILSNGIKDVFDFDKSAFAIYRMNAGPTEIKDKTSALYEYYENMFALTDMEIDQATWVQNHVSGGNRLLCRSNFDVKVYKQILSRFFNNKYFAERWDHYKKTGFQKCYGFYQDQNVETIAYLTMGIVNQDLGKYVSIFISHPKKWDNVKKFIRRPIFHNATVSHKHSLLKYLRMRGEIK